MGELIKNMLDVRHRIAARIFVWFFCSLYAVMLVFLVYYYSINSRQVRSAIEQTAGEMLTQSGALLQTTLKDIQEPATFLLSDENVVELLTRDMLPPSLDWFNAYQETNKLMRNYTTGRSRIIAGMAIVKPDGQTCITGTIYAPIRQSDIAREGTRFVVSQRYPYLVRAVPTSRGLDAVLITQLAEDFWAQIYGQHLLEQYVLCVYDSRGNPIYTSDNYAQQDESHRTLMRGVAEGEAPEQALEKCLMLTQHAETPGLTAVVWVPQAVIAESLAPLQWQLLMSLVLSFFVSAVLSRLLAMSITRDVKILKHNVELIGQGNYRETLPLRSQDEIGELGQTLSQLSARIETLIADINLRETLKREMELTILRAQVSPHFLYNALNTIAYLGTLQGADNIVQFSTALIDLLRTALGSGDVLISLEQELSYVCSYHEIMKYRCFFSVALEMTVDPGAQEARVMRMLLQPLVENAIIHGIAPQQQDGLIRISVRREGGDLMMSVTDNGTGMTKPQIEAAFTQAQNRDPLRFSGIGIRNVQDRIRLQYGEAYGLSIDSEPGVFTRVCIRMPLILQEVGPA